MKRAEARQGSRQFPPPLSKSNGAVCLQNMQMKCKSAEPWANGGGFMLTSSWQYMVAHTLRRTCRHVAGWMDAWMDGWMDGWIDGCIGQGAERGI